MPTNLLELFQAIRGNKSTPDSENLAELVNGYVTIRNRIVSIGGTILQISNISTMGIIDLSRKKPIPWYFWLLLLIDLGLFSQYQWLGFIGLLCLGYILYRHYQNRHVSRFLLRMQLNSGFVANVLSNELKTLEDIVLEICRVIEHKVEGDYNATFHINNVDVSNSVVNTGNVSGGIENKVKNL